MNTKPKKRILYGEANYKNMVDKNGYYVDKTGFIRLLENYSSPVFLRPRRFGKSLWCTTLEYYYDINKKDNFEELFGHTEIGKNPTPLHNRFMVLPLDFSIINPSGGIEDIRSHFNQHCNIKLLSVTRRYRKFFEEPIKIDLDKDVSINLEYILAMINDYDLPRLYVIIDEYDNFSNQLITSHQDALYRELMADNSFLKNFFKTLKNGTKHRTIATTFITGVLPLTIDDLASGYNIADFITLKEKFETMMGFTQQETDQLIDEIYRDYEIDPVTLPLVREVITANYNGYRFVNPGGEGIFNSTILMYFLREFIEYKKIPEYLIDVNLKTDISWVKRLTASNPANTGELVNRLLIENRLSYNKLALLEKFNLSQFFEKSFYPISFYYLGMLTKRDDQYMCLPNLNMKSIFVDYFNELNKIDVSTKYAELMAGFINQPDIPELFAGYWELYVSQLPEAIFQQVNENFYRTTFFDLCRQHLSGYFTWALESSYASGRTDLEFIGKYHTQFAGLRFLLEFKYYSNARWNKISRGLPVSAGDGEMKKGDTGVPGKSKKTGKKTAGKNVSKISQFQALDEDIKKLKTYGAEWKKQHPHPGNKSFLVYCFGNQGYRVFPVNI
ncbi:MAG: AAA family ATPase [Candidatus Aminicenantes bacterium]|nr:MAG: AAA family ATPase [Candidatus Aminicenantes bacterium]